MLDGDVIYGSSGGGQVVRISKPDEANSFLREVEALSLLRHPNIMPFYGAVLLPPAQCWLVCELMGGGTLGNWLYGPNADPRCGPSPPRCMHPTLPNTNPACAIRTAAADHGCRYGRPRR